MVNLGIIETTVQMVTVKGDLAEMGVPQPLVLVLED
jgi:hypothetical protein